MRLPLSSSGKPGLEGDLPDMTAQVSKAARVAPVERLGSASIHRRPSGGSEPNHLIDLVR